MRRRRGTSGSSVTPAIATQFADARPTPAHASGSLPRRQALGELSEFHRSPGQHDDQEQQTGSVVGVEVGRSGPHGRGGR
jgi:hypothetical protein